MSTITAAATAPIHAPRSASVRRLLVGVLLALIVVGTALAAHLGCERMQEAAPLGSVDSHGRTVTGHSWSISPIGFSVRYDDGTSATHLWW
jgi:hypothetical protein